MRWHSARAAVLVLRARLGELPSDRAPGCAGRTEGDRLSPTPFDSNGSRPEASSDSCSSGRFRPSHRRSTIRCPIRSSSPHRQPALPGSDAIQRATASCARRLHRRHEPLRSPPQGDVAAAAASTQRRPDRHADLHGSVDELDGAERCYAVRAVRGDGTQTVEGTPSDRPRASTRSMTFLRQAPAGLSAAIREGAISLIWEPNAEPDLAGYLVLRGEAGDATLQPLTDRPVTETRFTDRTVEARHPVCLRRRRRWTRGCRRRTSSRRISARWKRRRASGASL